MTINVVSITIGLDSDDEIKTKTIISNELLKEKPNAKRIISDAVLKLTYDIFEATEDDLEIVSTRLNGQEVGKP